MDYWCCCIPASCVVSRWPTARPLRAPRPRNAAGRNGAGGQCTLSRRRDKDSVLALAARGGTEVWHAIEPGFYAASPASAESWPSWPATGGRSTSIRRVARGSGALEGARCSSLLRLLSGDLWCSSAPAAASGWILVPRELRSGAVDLNAAAAGGVVASDGLPLRSSRAAGWLPCAPIAAA